MHCIATKLYNSFILGEVNSELVVVFLSFHIFKVDVNIYEWLKNFTVQFFSEIYEAK